MAKKQSERELYYTLKDLIKEPLDSNRYNKAIKLWDSNKLLRSYFFDFFYEAISGDKLNDELRRKIKIIEEYNSEIWETLNLDFIYRFGNIFTIEQLLRITVYKEIEEKILILANHKMLYNLILYILKNDNNWIISLNRVLDSLFIDSISKWMENFAEFKELIESTSEISDKKISDEIMEAFASLISEKYNYFNVKSYEDLLNYEQKKNEVCLRILQGDNTITLHNSLSYHSEELYKFALLEYKFGISLEEAEELVEKYGEDAEKLPKGELSDFIKLLKEIVNSENIRDIVNGATENGYLGNPWTGFPTAREAEGKILNLFEELYNKTLYKPTKDDKEELPELYVDSNGSQHRIDVYKLKKDFNMCVRREQAFSKPTSYRYSSIINNYKMYYNRHNVRSHGNSESFIGNDCIAIAYSNKIIVGYEHIYNNQLAGGSIKVYTKESRKGIATFIDGSKFSMYKVKNVDLRTPEEMLNNTRMNGSNDGKVINFNEIFKDRIYIDENGNVSIYQPNFLVWIEEETEETRKKLDWKEKNRLWRETKKAAAQLGLPIVIIDREYYAKREMKKVELMKKLLSDDTIDENEYSEFLRDYQNLDKSTIIKRIFTTIENNRTGLMTNEKLAKKYFTNEFREKTSELIFETIEKVDKEEAIKCLNALIEVAKKELSFDFGSDYVECNLQYYKDLKEKAQLILKRYAYAQNNKDRAAKSLLLLYLRAEVNKADVLTAKDSIIRLHVGESEEYKHSIF